MKPGEHVAVSVVVDPAQPALALWRGGPLPPVLEHEAGGELVQQPGGGAHLYSTVQYSTVQYSTVQYSTVQYSIVQYSIVQYIILQYSIVQYSIV